MRLVPSSLGGRLVLAASLFTIVALAVTLGVMDRLLDRFVTGQIDQRLDNKIVTLASQIRVASDGSISLEGDADGPPFDDPHHQSFWYVAGPRNVVESRWLRPGAFTPPSAAAIAAAPGPPPLPPPGGPPGRPARTLRVDGPGGIAVHMRAAVRDIAGTRVTLLAAAPRRMIADPVGEAMRTVGAAILALGIASLAAAFVLSRVVLRPLTRMRAEIAEIGAGHRVALSTTQPREVLPLVEELNALIAQNAANLVRARRHVANLAHGLKTPLATLSLAVGRLDGEAAAPMQGLVGAIERRVRHHLGRARAAALDGPVRVATPLAPRLADLIEALRKIYADKGLDIELDCPTALALACEPQDVDEIFGNLLDNSCKFARGRVTCVAHEEGTDVMVAIRDDGPGLDASEILRVLRPGERLDEDVPGFGFGLPIARELVELYAGSITLIPQTSGLRVELVLPKAV